ncbi:uncharacterized protein BJX67DRAFT_346702 [Aspergillus lucknowensis]|uniref:DUF4139 domain-containing protein n=1 Tax=Aspergillus lucknowensis TaxID=176173 RepID=A0ABR4M2S3_9EURO
MEDTAATEILLADLPTKEVTLAPKQITVVREIRTTIQPGQNELTILGLDPRVNTHSIRIEGSGPATITDLQTSIVPRREHFEDVYPSESESDNDNDKDDNTSDEDISEDEDGLDDPTLQSIRTEITALERKIATARSDINSALSVLGIMDSYAKGLQTEKNRDVAKFESFLALYNSRRGAEAERFHRATAEVSIREKELAKAQRRFQRRKVKYAREQREASKAIRVRNEKRARAKERKRKAKETKRSDRRVFWTANVGQVVVCLDRTQSVALTPGSSRRSSVVEKVSDEKQGDPVDVVLRLSYMIPWQGWSSRYELEINSPSSSARLTYRAEFNNLTSETWRDTRVTLSTSQASFGGIGVRIPSLDPWNIKLVTAQSKAPSWVAILDAPVQYPLGPVPPPFPQKQLWGAPAPQVPAAQKGSLFGTPGQARPNPYVPPPAKPFGAAPQQTVQSAGLFGGAPAAAPTQAGGLFGGSAATTNSSSGFGSAAQGQQSVSVFGAASSSRGEQTPSGSLFGAAPSSQPRLAASTDPDGHGDGPRSSPPPAPATTSLFGRLAQPENPSPKENSTTVELEDNDNDDDDADTDTLASGHGALEHKDPVKQDYGMTTTYELPGRRTLPPSSTARRHVLAELDLNAVQLTYVIVPKRREAAFLRARIKNSSSITLHPGSVGITVDGSFVGSAALDTCAPAVFFNISLGIDPGIEVKYAKPSVKPLPGAMFFNKEDGAKFRRSCWVKNTKGVAVDLVVSEQVPVSEDEKLRVRVLQPAGIEKEGDEVDVKMGKAKGSGTVSLCKNGEVKWALRLEPSQEIRLVLEYEAKVPSGSDVVSV